MPKAELMTELLPRRARDLADVYLDWLAKQKTLVVQGDLVNLPGRKADLQGGESELGQKITEAFEGEGLTPRSPNELCRELGAQQQTFDGMLKYLTAQGKLVRLPSGLFLSRKALDDLEGQVLGSDWETFGVPEFKDRFGLSRKWAIPLLEYLDVKGVTKRKGNERVVLRR